MCQGKETTLFLILLEINFFKFLLFKLFGVLICELHNTEEKIMAKGQQRKNKEEKKPKKKPLPVTVSAQ